MNILTDQQLLELSDREIANLIRERRGQEPFSIDEWFELDQYTINQSTNERRYD